MFKHFFLHTFRSFTRNPGYLILNLLGMSIGLTASILIGMYVLNELSFDRFHTGHRAIYRVLMDYRQKDESQKASTIVAAVGPSLAEAFPGIRSFIRVSNPRDGFFETDGKIIPADQIVYADSGFFEGFSFKLISGNKTTVLNKENTVVLTQKTAAILFGNQNPLGRVIRFNNKLSLVVTGIAEDAPANSHLQFNALISFSTLYLDKTNHMGWNGGNQYFTYIVMQAGVNPSTLAPLLPVFLEEHINRDMRSAGMSVNLVFEPLSTIHLFSEASEGGEVRGSISNILIFSAIAIFILLIACFNFTNLSTAAAVRRARETGVRKVCGADRKSLILQYLGEAIVMSLAALFIALIFIELLQPYYNALIGSELSLYGPLSGWLLPAVILIVILTGMIAGAYPAFYLSSFRPVMVLKGGFETGKGRALLPKILVVMQFVISVTLINCTWIIFTQLGYMKNHDKGFRSSNILAITLPDETSAMKCEVLQNEFRNLAGVVHAGAASEIPGNGFTRNGYMLEGENTVRMINVVDADAEFVPVFGLKIAEGRNFLPDLISDKQAVLVNEAFAGSAGWEQPVGKKISRNGIHKVIGVVKDFNYAPLHFNVEPLIITQQPYGGFSYIVIETQPGLQTSVVAEIEKIWKKILPEEPFTCTKVSDMIESGYSQEAYLGHIFSWFTALAVFVACLGLFGLAGFAMQKRKHEVGIRIVLGATQTDILRLLTSGFVVLVLIANVISVPVSWLMMSEWLGNFSYSIRISPIIFVSTALLSVLIALITTGWQAVSATRTRPVEVIKYE